MMAFSFFQFVLGCKRTVEFGWPCVFGKEVIGVLPTPELAAMGVIFTTE